MTAMWRCDLLERPIERISLSNDPNAMAAPHHIYLPMKPFAIETLLLEFGEQSAIPSQRAET